MGSFYRKELRKGINPTRPIKINALRNPFLAKKKNLK